MADTESELINNRVVFTFALRLNIFRRAEISAFQIAIK